MADVSVMAPLENRSGVSRALTLDRTIAVKDVALADGSPAFAVDGTPADCVRFAALGLTNAAFLDRTPLPRSAQMAAQLSEILKLQVVFPSRGTSSSRMLLAESRPISR